MHVSANNLYGEGSLAHCDILQDGFVGPSRPAALAVSGGEDIIL